ncbi:unnamed protein product [Ranitomeya imitator]|uniref:L-serine deaminase n=1 Tax=Ranitomeya imitator TaxID=111125 RepID=A0ABN9LVV4_9NEOB|nr:unnamed protein product [Ranitomeya imitator]
MKTRLTYGCMPPEARAGHNVLVTVWDDADAYAHRLTEAPGSVYISPFNHPLVWEGHSSLILELKSSLGNQKPGALVVAVGGGGLLAGLVEGIVKVGWSDVPIIAMETVGAHCLNAALQAGRPVSLPDITSIAKCLGAKTVCDRALECAKKYKVISVTVDDKDALAAVEMFLESSKYKSSESSVDAPGQEQDASLCPSPKPKVKDASGDTTGYSMKLFTHTVPGLEREIVNCPLQDESDMECTDAQPQLDYNAVPLTQITTLPSQCTEPESDPDETMVPHPERYSTLHGDT